MSLGWQQESMTMKLSKKACGGVRAKNHSMKYPYFRQNIAENIFFWAEKFRNNHDKYVFEFFMIYVLSFNLKLYLVNIS